MQDKILILGGGCFWCLDAIFQSIVGVKKVLSGYADGTTKNPSYQDVCNGTSGHAEVVKIEYDEEKIKEDILLRIFFDTHDSNSLNRQGNDVGTQYRSTIICNDEYHEKTIQKYITTYLKEGFIDKTYTTKIVLLKKFYEAEEYHQNYFFKNPSQQYCEFIVKPKLDKLLKNWTNYLKN